MDNQPQQPLPNQSADGGSSYPPGPQVNPPQQSATQPGYNSAPVQPQPTVFSPTNQPQPVAQPVVVVGNTSEPNNAANTPQQTPYQNPVVSTPVNTRKKSKMPLIIISLVIILALIGGGAYALFGTKTSYQSVIQKFITAMQDNNGKEADKLLSPAAKAQFQKAAGTSSFYSVCKQAGQLCQPLFSSSFLSKATKQYTSYTADNHTKGEQVIYTETETLQGAAAGGQGCSSKSTTTLSIAVVPSGNTWLVDYVNEGVNASANLCSSSTTTTSVPTQSTPAKANASTPTTNAAPTTTASCTPTQSNIDQATSDTEAIQSGLEAYFTDKTYYPSDIAYSNFSSYGADQSAYNPPPCIHFVYTPSPTSCSTASQNCQHYVLYGADTSGKAVTSQIQSLN